MFICFIHLFVALLVCIVNYSLVYVLVLSIWFQTWQQRIPVHHPASQHAPVADP